MEQEISFVATKTLSDIAFSPRSHLFQQHIALVSYHCWRQTSHAWGWAATTHPMSIPWAEASTSGSGGFGGPLVGWPSPHFRAAAMTMAFARKEMRLVVSCAHFRNPYGAVHLCMPKANLWARPRSEAAQAAAVLWSSGILESQRAFTACISTAAWPKMPSSPQSGDGPCIRWRYGTMARETSEVDFLMVFKSIVTALWCGACHPTRPLKWNWLMRKMQPLRELVSAVPPSQTWPPLGYWHLQHPSMWSCIALIRVQTCATRRALCVSICIGRIPAPSSACCPRMHISESLRNTMVNQTRSSVKMKLVFGPVHVGCKCIPLLLMLGSASWRSATCFPSGKSLSP